MQQGGPSDWVDCLYQLRSTFPRLLNQQGFFTVASRLGVDHEKVIPNLLKEHAPSIPCTTVRFAASLKPGLLRSLERKGVTGASLFPGVEGVCYHLRDLIQYARDEHGVQRWIEEERTGTYRVMSRDELESLARQYEDAAVEIRKRLPPSE